MKNQVVQTGATNGSDTANPVKGYNTHPIQKGSKVEIHNRTFGGRSIVEGTAEIVRPVKDVDNYYRVRFESGDEVDRFVTAPPNGRLNCGKTPIRKAKLNVVEREIQFLHNRVVRLESDKAILLDAARDLITALHHTGNAAPNTAIYPAFMLAKAAIAKATTV